MSHQILHRVHKNSGVSSCVCVPLDRRFKICLHKVVGLRGRREVTQHRSRERGGAYHFGPEHKSQHSGCNLQDEQYYQEQQELQGRGGDRDENTVT